MIEKRFQRIRRMNTPLLRVIERKLATAPKRTELEWFRMVHMPQTFTKVGDRVKIIRKKFEHKDMDVLRGVVGTVSQIFEQAGRQLYYEVAFDEPIGPRGYTHLYPVYPHEIESI